MRLRDTILTAYSGITVNKTRAMLTTLGIIIGVASVVLMVSVGRSFQNYIVTIVESVGTNTLDIFPVGIQKFGGKLDSLSFEDFNAIKQLSTVTDVMPVIFVPKTVKFGKEQVNPMVIGTYNKIFSNYGQKLASGRLLEQADEDGAKPVAVLGAKTAIDLFGNANPVGQRISVGENSFTVIGVTQDVGSALLSELSNIVYVPYSTAKAATAQTHLSYITLKTVGDQAIAKDDITALLRQRHRITNPTNDPDKDDFIARSAEQVTSIITSVTLGLTIFLALVAAISLLVGGIGLMNIMLVSVTERTREIGLRKAVGASGRDILLQFLFEAVALTLIGGAAGILIGAGAGWVLALLANKFLGDFTFVLSIPAVLLAVGMAMTTGLVFGIYPAKRAAALNPIEALRFE